MNVWSARPRLSHAALFVLAYVLGGGFAQALATVPGTGVSIWPPSGLFLATLIVAPKKSWPWWILAAFFSENVGNLLWFHNPLAPATLIFAGNAAEAAFGAWILRRLYGPSMQLQTYGEVLALILLGACISPLISATIGSMALAVYGIHPFGASWLLWWIGDGTGVATIAPLALVVFQNWDSKSRVLTARWAEACALAAIFLAVAVLSITGYEPYAYVVLPPLLWAAVRFEFKGAVLALILLAVIATVVTISGTSQFAGDQQSQREKQIMLQLFLGISAFSALIVAAISRQHQQALATLKKNVAALKERERELSHLVDMLPIHIRRLTPEGEPVFFNKRLLDFFGLADISQLDRPGMSRLAMAAQSLIHPEDADMFSATVRHTFATGEPYTMRYRLRRADGVYRWVEGRGEPVRDEEGNIAQWLAVSIDIEDSVSAQQKLHENERRLQRLVDAVPAQIWCSSPEGDPIYINQQLRNFHGMELEDFDAPDRSRGDVAQHKHTHPDDLVAVRDRLAECRRTGEPFHMKYRMRRADGVYRWVEGRSEPYRDEDGSIVQWYGVLFDIDEQVKAEETLREKERFLWQLVETLPAMIDCAAPNGEPIFRGKGLREFLGYELDTLDGSGKSRLEGTLDAGVHPDDVEGVKLHYGRCLAAGEPYARRHRLRRFDGEYRWVETRAAPMRDAEGVIIQWNVICLDVDAEVKAEEDLRLAHEGLARASQAASMAELSASIAHEVNQPLSAVINSTTACLSWLQADPPNIERARKSADRTIQSAHTAVDVIRRIRALFQQSVDIRDSTSLDAVVGEVRDLVAADAAKQGISIQADIEGNLDLLAFDRVQIQQVLMNLVRNGIDAMAGETGERTLHIRVYRADDRVHTEVSDRGIGIRQPEKIFDPFFTTKNKGMGMGLAISRSIVEAHGGKLWAEDNHPSGAKFIFTLPTAIMAAA